MPRRRRDCPICSKKNLAKLSNHLADIHQLSGKERQHYLSKARSLTLKKGVLIFVQILTHLLVGFLTHLKVC